MHRYAFPTAFFATCLILGSTTFGDFSFDFSEGDQLDGDTIGGTAVYNDPTTATTPVDVTLTTVGGHTNMFLNSGNMFLGLGPTDTTRFNGGEFWEFEFDRLTYFQSMTFGQMDDETFDQVLLQSDDWIGAGFVPTDPSRVTFDNATGVFTLDRGLVGGISQTWTLSDLTGGAQLSVAVGSTYSISAGMLSAAVMTNATFQAIPEPGTAILLALPMIGLISQRRRRQR